MLTLAACERGQGRLRTALVEGTSVITACGGREPLRLLTPRHRGRASWVAISGYGGGLVDGDHIKVDVEVSEGSRLYLGTQATTKVFKAESAIGCRQTLTVSAADDTWCCNLPDAVSAYTTSRWHQATSIDAAASSHILWLDWTTAGREGECWSHDLWTSDLRVTVDGHTILRDRLRIPNASASLQHYRACGTCYIQGPALTPFLADLVPDSPPRHEAAVMVTASPCGPGHLVRFVAKRAEDWIAHLTPRLDHLTEALGGNPWARKF